MSTDRGGFTRRSKIGGALFALGVVLLVVPSLAPVQPVLYHETNTGTLANETTLEQQGYTVVEYENLSDRGQELYVTALENDGHYTVSVGQGANDFPYPTDAELGEYENHSLRDTAQSVVIERPADTDLPPADERLRAAEYRARDESAEEGETPTTPSEAEIQQIRDEIARYDKINTRTGEPQLGGSQHLLRLLSLLTWVVAVGTGGYLHSTHG